MSADTRKIDGGMQYGIQKLTKRTWSWTNKTCEKYMEKRWVKFGGENFGSFGEQNLKLGIWNLDTGGDESFYIFLWNIRLQVT